ncbi:DUF2061 domain-containing protein [Octadecabacter sp. G9-8]|uniref:DUF2061 domain-containing protein n=1 Tax=Octadecabacter dasysiphoniae TaxID=2909341 RepID=A0ABS9CVA7_9RHOB|nr:DUF2061 domain-containing protein [Octadecabacter dasysiphoniae]MCF2869958.1 DUF2061 domain-containing protein [Octadecabacter dasysiphoniae]
MDTRKRTIVKALIWNVIGLLTMIMVGFIATGSFKLGGVMAAVNTLIGLSMYVIYERVWAQVRWGRHV